jgi:hypothetical protein
MSLGGITLRAAPRVWERFPRGLLLLGLWIAGCGPPDGLDRRAVSGQVTWGGHPLASGAILFEPAGNATGTAVGATIRNGRYAIARSEGPVPGHYLVRIYASSGVVAPAPLSTIPGRHHPRPMVELIPERYNAHTELRVELEPDGPGVFNFALAPSPTGPSEKP